MPLREVNEAIGQANASEALQCRQMRVHMSAKDKRSFGYQTLWRMSPYAKFRQNRKSL
jgi:hypothetical protein